MKKLNHILFWVLTTMCISLVALVRTGGITNLVTFLAIVYVGLGGLFTGINLLKSSKERR